MKILEGFCLVDVIGWHQILESWVQIEDKVDQLDSVCSNFSFHNYFFLYFFSPLTEVGLTLTDHVCILVSFDATCMNFNFLLTECFLVAILASLVLVPFLFSCHMENQAMYESSYQIDVFGRFKIKSKPNFFLWIEIKICLYCIIKLISKRTLRQYLKLCFFFTLYTLGSHVSFFLNLVPK